MLSMLNVDFSDLADDSRRAIELRTSVSRNDHARASGVLADPLFELWITTSRSGFLILNGNDDDYRGGAFSGLSYYAAKLRSRLNVRQYAYSTAFNCGRHQRDGDPLGGVVGMLRAFSYYILSDWDEQLDLSAMKEDLLAGLELGGINRLSKFFGNLIEALAKTKEDYVVFFIDGAHVLESEQNVKDFKFFLEWMSFLLGTMEERGDDLCVKFILMYPQRSQHAVKVVSEANVMNASLDEYAWLEVKNEAEFHRDLDRCFGQ